MKLHYSQTNIIYVSFFYKVLLPYEITLFSNKWNGSISDIEVLLPYEITLFSNLS